MIETDKTQAPPPSYQQGQQAPGQTYYQPPPAPGVGEYASPPPITNNGGGVGQRFTQFYAPPQNKSLGKKRRYYTFICCCIIIGLIIGLAAGLTSASRNYYNSCNCRTNSDCINTYGSGTYCYNSCECARL